MKSIKWKKVLKRAIVIEALLLSVGAVAQDHSQGQTPGVRADGKAEVELAVGTGSGSGAKSETPAAKTGAQVAALATSKKPSDGEFEMPASCEEKMTVTVTIPCSNDGIGSLKGKSIGVAFTGATGSYYHHAFDKLDRSEGSDGASKDFCTGEFQIKDKAAIERILLGKLKPGATVSPGNGQWLHYAGTAIGAEGNVGQQTVFNESKCELGLNMENPKKAADLASATAQCEAEYRKPHLVDGKASTIASNGKTTSLGEEPGKPLTGACRNAVEEVAKLGGAAPIVCKKTINDGEQFEVGGDDVAYQCSAKVGEKSNAVSALTIKALGSKENMLFASEAHRQETVELDEDDASTAGSAQPAGAPAPSQSK